MAASTLDLGGLNRNSDDISPPKVGKNVDYSVDDVNFSPAHAVSLYVGTAGTLKVKMSGVTSSWDCVAGMYIYGDIEAIIKIGSTASMNVVAQK